MDLINLYVQKNELDKLNNNNLESTGFLKLFLSNENKLKISRLLYNEIYLSNNIEEFNSIKKIVDEFLESWTTKKDFKKIFSKGFKHFQTKDLLIDYLNKSFIDKFKNIIVKYDLFEFQRINNPYNHIFEYKINNKIHSKKISQMTHEDLNYITFNNNNDKFNRNNLFNDKYHDIKYYEKSIYKRNIDKEETGQLETRTLFNNNHKKYNNNELLNNIDYLK